MDTIRDNNVLRYNQLGPDTGYDCINNLCTALQKWLRFFNALTDTDALPKTIHLLSESDTTTQSIGTVIGCFQDAKAVGKNPAGFSAWWFNDHKVGMTNSDDISCKP